MSGQLKHPLPDHPCMNDAAHHRVARIHLPVAPRCTVACGYCERKTGSLMEKPGNCLKIMGPDEAVSEAMTFLDEWGPNAIVGIAGPGDPLANGETFETLENIRKKNTNARLCLCTNGLHLPECLPRLKAVDLNFLTVTVNAVTGSILEKIYYSMDGDQAATLARNQLEGIENAAKLGIFIKVNMVVIPGINDHHAEVVARTVSGLGATVLNLMPLIPGGRFRDVLAPSRTLMDGLFARCEPYISVFRSCRKCRADARGIPGKDGCTWKKTA